MSILGSIFSKILGHHPAAPAPTPASDTTPTPPIAGTPPAQTAAGTPAPSEPAPGTPAPDTPTTAGMAPGGTPPSAPAAPAGVGAPVDVAAMLDGLAQKNSQTLDWKHSIVDMLKLLDLDSSLASRQALAKELNYSGDMHDSATMNIWLHSQVMAKLAQNGGKVPDDLRH